MPVWKTESAMELLATCNWFKKNCYVKARLPNKMSIPACKLGPFPTVGKQGFGCMGMSAFYASAKTTTEADAIAVFHEAVASGVTLFNSADFYGPLNADGFGHNLRCSEKFI
jgi:diketogulonate reductase-like aldo/keto reductase